MDTTANTARSIASNSSSLAELTDTELLAGTRRLVGRSNQLLAELLAHLGEVEARGIHRTRACSSLYVYCIYELRLSEDEAYRRVAAARLLRRFPPLFEALASGALHLTGLLMLGPHLTNENLVEVLARAKHRTKREIARLVRFLDPLPAVPARIEPLGPAPVGVARNAPSWVELTESFSPVRELEPGERPSDWLEVADDRGADEGKTRDRGEPRESTRADVELDAMTRAGAEVGATRAGAELDATTRAGAKLLERKPTPPARELTPPERFKVQFTATEEYVRLIEEAMALLSHTVQNPSLEDIQLRAMRAFVTALRKRRYGANYAAPATDPAPEPTTKPASPRQRGRHIPAPVRSAVFARDGARCTFVDANGRRCPETHHLDFHHLEPFARDGAHELSNLTLRCSAHNALAAEEDFGADRILAKKDVVRHEALTRQGITSPTQ